MSVRHASMPERSPCPEGFHWIGQSFASCDMCGLPAWEHAGEARYYAGAGPFDGTPKLLVPWAPGQADRIRAKWDPELPVWMCNHCRTQWDRFEDEARPPGDLVIAHSCDPSRRFISTLRGLG